MFFWKVSYSSHDCWITRINFVFEVVNLFILFVLFYNLVIVGIGFDRIEIKNSKPSYFSLQKFY